MNPIACNEATDATPDEAERIEHAVLFALAVLQHRAGAAVARFLDDCAELHLDVLHHEPPPAAV